MVWIAILVWSIICFLIGYIAAMSKATEGIEYLLYELERQIKDGSYYGKEEKNSEEKNGKEEIESFEPVRETYIDKTESGPCKLKFRDC